MRWRLTREMSVFSVKINMPLPPIVRRRLLLFFYTEIRTVSLMLLAKNTLCVYNTNKLTSVRNNYRKIEWQTYYPATLVF